MIDHTQAVWSRVPPAQLQPRRPLANDGHAHKQRNDTNTLVDLYTLLSDVQQSADDFRQQISDMLLNRLHHDWPVTGQYGPVQRTTCRQRSLNADQELGIDPEQVWVSIATKSTSRST